MAAIDLHTHTRFFHGFDGRPTGFDPTGLRLLSAVAGMRGLDAVAVTNHDYYERFDVDTGDVSVIPGIEVTTTAGHVLVVGADPPARTKPNVLTPGEVVETARNRNCAVVMAHPFRNGSLPASAAEFDAIEVNGKRSGPVEELRNLAAERGRPLVGGSDAHYPVEVGRAYTEIDLGGEPVTPRKVVEAIRDGRVDYGVDERFPSQLLRRAYAVVHRLKGHT